MGEKPDQIEQHIYETRSELGENIQELQSKVKHAVDWRAQFEERPWTMVGLAFGGGVLLSALMGGTRRPRYSGARRREQWRSERSHREYTDNGRTNERSDKASETWNNVKGAVVALAMTKLSGYLEEVLPGFKEHYDKNQNQKKQLGYSASPNRSTEQDTSWQRRESDQSGSYIQS